MKKAVLFFCILAVMVIFSVMFFNKGEESMIVKTFALYEEITLEKKVELKDSISIICASDDLIEKIHVKVGDQIEIGDILISLENKEEQHQLSRAKNEFAVSLLNSGRAVQEEKKQAVELAQQRLEKTEIESPLNGYILEIPVIENLFVSKGTVLSRLVPTDFKGFMELTTDERKLISDSEFVQFKLIPGDSTVLLNDPVIKLINGRAYLELRLSEIRVNMQQLNLLYCELKISHIAGRAAWIPADFVSEGKIYLQNGVKKNITIIDQKEDIYLIEGIEDGQIIIAKR